MPFAEGQQNTTVKLFNAMERKQLALFLDHQAG
jgi:hypothetical protein